MIGLTDKGQLESLLCYAVALMAAATLCIGGAGEAHSQTPEAVVIKQTSGDLLKKAGRAYKAKKYGEAESLYKARIKEDPDDMKAYEGLGKVYRKQKRWGDVVSAYEAGRQANAGWVRGLYLLGYAQRKAGNYGESATFYQRYIEEKPEDPDAYYGLGESYRKGGESKRAIEALRRYLELENRPSEEKWRKRAKSSIADLERSLEEGSVAESVTESGPEGDVLSLIVQGDDAMKARDVGKAARFYKAAADAEGVDGYKGHYKLGVSEAAAGNLPAAIAAWEIVVMRAPKMTVAKKNLKRARVKLKAMTEAGVDDPAMLQTSDDKLTLVRRYMSEYRPAMALRVLDPMLKSSPTDGGVRLARGVALMALGRYIEAGRELDLALAQRPGDEEVFRALGQNALLLKDNARALYFISAYLERVDPVGKNPRFEAQRVLMRRLQGEASR